MGDAVPLHVRLSPLAGGCAGTLSIRSALNQTGAVQVPARGLDVTVPVVVPLGDGLQMQFATPSGAWWRMLPLDPLPAVNVTASRNATSDAGPKVTASVGAEGVRVNVTTSQDSWTTAKGVLTERDGRRQLAVFVDVLHSDFGGGAPGVRFTFSLPPGSAVDVLAYRHDTSDYLCEPPCDSPQAVGWTLEGTAHTDA